MGPFGQAGSAGPQSHEPICATCRRGWDPGQNLWVGRVRLASCKILSHKPTMCRSQHSHSKKEDSGTTVDTVTAWGNAMCLGAVISITQRTHFGTHNGPCSAWLYRRLARMGTQGTQHTAENVSRKRMDRPVLMRWCPGASLGLVRPCPLQFSGVPSRKALSSIGIETQCQLCRFCLFFLAAVTPAGGQAGPNPVPSGVTFPGPA